MKDHYDTQEYGLRCVSEVFSTAYLLLFGQCSEHQATASEMGTSKHKAAGAYHGIHHRGHPEYT